MTRYQRGVRRGTGQTHHFAPAAAEKASQLEGREKILHAVIRISPVMDRIYFKSIHTSDPDGHLVELATMGPGFAADEPVAQLGDSLRLPPWLEAPRRELERNLKPLVVPEWRENCGEARHAVLFVAHAARLRL